MRSIFVILLFLVGTIILIAGCTENASTTSVSSANSVRTYNIGDTASDGISSVTVNSMKFISYKDMGKWQSSYEQKFPGGQILLVKISVKNLQRDNKINAPFGVVGDNSGQTYDSQADEMMFSPYFPNTTKFDESNILPGETRVGNEGFVIPITATGLTYRYSMNSGQIAVFNLK